LIERRFDVSRALGRYVCDAIRFDGTLRALPPDSIAQNPDKARTMIEAAAYELDSCFTRTLNKERFLNS
jgi:hypothetical protein